MSSENLTGTVEADVEIDASPADFFHMVRHKPHHISNASSDKVQGCDLHEGEWGTVGSIICWNYHHDGQPRMAKEIIEAIDEEKNLMSFRVIEGDIMEHFKSFVITIRLNSEPDGNGCVVHWHLEYEKHHGEIVDPHTLLQFLLEVSKDMETHILEDKALEPQTSAAY